MGIELPVLVLYPPPQPGSPWLLARVTRPSAPNAAQPAVDFAEELADAKAHALVRAWLASNFGADLPVPEPIGWCYPALDEDLEGHPLVGFTGSEFDLWWTASVRHPSSLEIGPGVDEAAFWAWLDQAISDRELADLRRPAERIRVRLLTEADARLVEHPLLLVDDVDWLSAEEFAHLHRGGGLEAELAELLPMQPAVTEQEVHAVKLGMVRRALAGDLEQDDRRAAAFRCSDLAKYDPDAALAMIERLAIETSDEDDRKGITWALAYALKRLRGLAQCEALIERWRAAEGLRAEVLVELATFRQ